MEIFRLFGSIFINTDAASQSISETTEKAKSFSEKLSGGFKAVGESATKVGAKMSLGLTAPLTLLGKKAVDVAADFEYSMSEVGAITGTVADNDLPSIIKKAEEMGLSFEKGANTTETAMNILSAEAKKMGETTKFSASESAEALKYMAMAGWKTEDMLDGLEGIMNLAAASGENLGTTSDIVTDALTAFGMQASDSGHFADILAKASSNANTNVSMMGETFKYIAPVAGALGFSAEDTALAIGLMANSGIKASQAGTSLRGALTNLASPTDKMIDVMVSLGLATEETTSAIDSEKLRKAQTKVENKTIDMEKAQIKYNEAVAKYGVNSSQAQTASLNLEKAQNNLEDAIHQLNSEQEGSIKSTSINNNLLVDSAGKTKSLREVMLTLRSAFAGLTEEEQTQAAATLFGKEAMSGMLAIINASGSDFDKLVSSIDSADGAAKEMADTMNDNLSGKITLLKSQIEGLMIQFVELIMPYLKQGVEWLSKVCDWVAGLDDGTKKMIITVAAVLAAAGPVLIFFGKVVTGIGSIIQAGGSLIGGIGKVSGGITGIISIGGKLLGGIGGIAGKIAGVLIPAIGSISGPVLAVIAVFGALVAAGVLIYKNWDEIREWAGNTWEKTKEIVGGAVDGIKEFFTSLGEKAGEMRDAVVSRVAELKDGAVQKFTELKESAVEKAAELKDRTVEKYQELKERAHEKVTELKERTVEKFGELKEKASAKVSELKERAVSEFSSLKDRAVDKFTELKDRASEKVSTLKENAVSKISELRDKAAEKIQSLQEKGVAGFEALRAKGLEKFDGLKSGVTEKLEAVKSFVSNTVQKLKDFFNFDWSLPKIKLPHFSMEGSFSLNPPSIPHIGVEWYKKAMDSPVVMEKPTAFGINSAGQIMAGGEAGSEVVSGTETLMAMISAAVAENNSRMHEILAQIYDILAQCLPGLADMQMVLDTGALVGEMSGKMNEELGWIKHVRGRWN